jgi:hypothetical protein
VAIILPPQPWTRQPQIPVGINAGHPLAEKLAIIVTSNLAIARENTRPLSIAVGSPSIAVGRLGIGPTFAGGLQRFDAGTAAISGASDPFTIEVLCSITVAPDLAGFFAGTYSGATGSARGLLSRSTIYYWGGAADLDSGITWRTDGSVQHVFVVSDGGAGANRIRFYRDGGLILTGTMPTQAVSTGAFIVGDTAQGWSSTPTGTLFKSAFYTRALSGSEIAALTANPWQVFAPLPRRAFAGPSAAGVYTLTADVGNFALSGQDATLSKSSILIAAAGSFALSGQDATLAKTSILVGDVGNFSLSGQDATLAWLPVGAYTLTAETGLFSLSGSDATLTASGAKQTKGGITKHKETKVKKSSTAVRDILRDIIDPQPAEIAQEMREAVLEASAPEVQVNAPPDEREQEEQSQGLQEEARRIARRRSVLHLLMQD